MQHETTDLELLGEFTSSNSQDAFASITRRYVDLVYSAALRRVRDRHLAEDVTQAVFIILAKRAHGFNDRILLPGWLHRATRYAAANAMRIESRRKQHERVAAENASLVNETSDRWNEVDPLLDSALDRLNGSDRTAIVLRFYQDKSVEQTATILGISTEAAKKRVQRAIQKLRGILSKNGVKLPEAALATTIASHTGTMSAPVGLADRAAAAAFEAIASTSAVSTSLLIAKGALTMMLWTKLKLAALIGVAMALVTGAFTLALEFTLSGAGSPQAAAPPAFVFSRIVERTVNDDGLAKDECIDFDTGKLHSHPAPFKDRAEGRAWFRSTGADAHGETEEGASGLYAMEMAVIGIENAQWDDDPVQLRATIAESRGTDPLMSADGDLPRTYLFRTREGAIGVCQITQLTRDAQQHGFMTIRYKLIMGTDSGK